MAADIKNDMLIIEKGRKKKLETANPNQRGGKNGEKY